MPSKGIAGSKVKAGSKVGSKVLTGSKIVGSKVLAGSRLKKTTTSAPKKVWRIDCSRTAKLWSEPSAADEPILIHQLREFLVQRLKVDGRTGALGEKVRVDVKDNSSISITSYVHYSKSTFKYLIKRFLKLKRLRDHMRVVADKKNSYQIRWFKIAGDSE